MILLLKFRYLWIHLKYDVLTRHDQLLPLLHLFLFERLWQRRPKTLAHRENMKGWWPHEGWRSIPSYIPSQSCAYLIPFSHIASPGLAEKKKKSKFSRSVGMAWGLTPDVHWINHGIWIFWRISYFWIKSCCPKGRKCMEISDTYLARLSSIPPPPNRSPKDQLCQRKLPIARSVGLLFLKHLTNNLTVAPCAGWRCG